MYPHAAWCAVAFIFKCSVYSLPGIEHLRSLPASMTRHSEKAAKAEKWATLADTVNQVCAQEATSSCSSSLGSIDKSRARLVCERCASRIRPLASRNRCSS